MRTKKEIQAVMDRVDDIGAEDYHHAVTIQEALGWVLGDIKAGFPYEESELCKDCDGYDQCGVCGGIPADPDCEHCHGDGDCHSCGDS